MSLYYVVRENDYLPRGTWVEDVDSVYVQAVHMVPDETGKLAPYTNYGILIPRDKLRKAMIRLQGKGIDEVGLKG